MSAEILSLLSGDNDQFAAGLVALGWYDYAPTVTEQQFRGKARSLLAPKLQSAGEVRKTDAYVYRLDVPGGRWQDARAIVESQLRAEPQFAIVFSRINGELYIFVPENPDNARSGSSLISAAYIRLDAARPKEFEEKLIQKLRGAPQDSFRAVLQSLTTVEKVTKKFYDEFKKEKDLFVTAIEGIPSTHDQKWYASVVLNRLMFIYFLQENDFLGEERNYLQSHVGRHEGYYRDFLMPLFLEGFAKREDDRSPETRELLGDIPYLNGGLFLRHRLEEQYGEAITIGNAALGRMLDFFSRYTWYIRDVPIQNEKHISPDVLGHIFEKYVNQKEMGAYYTKPDITGYICRNTIIPRLFDMLAETGDRGKNAVRPLRLPNGSVIEDYVYNAVKQTDYLPTETDREYRARRERYESILGDFRDGKISEINEFITYNLDIEQFAEDFVDHINDAEVLRRFYFDCVKAITVLDPTCGSGAFLLTAVEILYPLYDGCLRRMQVLVKRADVPRADARTMRGEFAFVNEADKQQTFMDPGSVKNDILSDFRKELTQFAEHPLEYYIHKSIIVNNLFGVDIEEEAVEICKLRLFLKLISHAELDASKENRGIEPLPDIDFNIRAGNTLVGYTSIEDIENLQSELQVVQVGEEKGIGSVGQLTLIADRDNNKLIALLGQYAVDQKRFREFQLGELPEDRLNKGQMERTRHATAIMLNKRLRDLYRDMGKSEGRKKFSDSHRPFHWMLEFPGVMHSGGFDVIVGNPPWCEYAKVRKAYTVIRYATESCGNLYAMCIERGLALRHPMGRTSFIVQLPLASSSRMRELRSLLRDGSGTLHVATFDDRPGKLFEGLEHSRSAIFISAGTGDERGRAVFTSSYQRWKTEARPQLLPCLRYTPVSRQSVMLDQFPKAGERLAFSVFEKMWTDSSVSVESALAKSDTAAYVFYQEATQYWVKATVALPFYAKNGIEGPPAHGRYVYFPTEDLACAVCSALNSSLFYMYFIALGDCFHLSDKLVAGFPLVRSIMGDAELVRLTRRLMSDLEGNAERQTIRTKGGDSICYDEYSVSASKPIIDEIDRLLAKHYGFTEEELDFIINYDIKYRMGRDADESEG